MSRLLFGRSTEGRATPSTRGAGGADSKPRQGAIGGTLHAALGQASGLLLSVVASVISARWLGPAIRGEYAVAVSVTAMAAAVAGAGIWSGLSARVAKGEWSPRVASRVAFAMMPWTAAVGLIAWWTTIAILGLRAGNLALCIGCTFYVVNAVANQQQAAVAASAGQVRYAVANSIWSALLQVALFALAYAAGVRPNLTLALGLTVAAQFTGTIIGWGALLFHDSRASQQLRLSDVATLVRFGLHAWPGLLLTVANARMDVAVMGVWVHKAAIGYYALAASLAALLGAWPVALAQGMSKRLGSSRERALAAARRGSWLALWGSGIAALLLAAFGRQLIAAFYGPTYSPAFLLLLVLLPGSAIFAPTYVLSAYATIGLERPALSSLTVLVVVAVDITFLIALAPRLGALGASIASLLGYFAGALANAVLVRRATKVGVMGFIVPSREDVKWLDGVLRHWLDSVSRATQAVFGGARS